MSTETNKNNDRRKSRKRVKLFKKIILLFMFAALILPTILCIALFDRVNNLEKQVAGLYRAVTEAEKAEESLRVENEKQAAPIPDSVQAQVEEVVEDSGRKVYLTFDDGPSSNTEEILDILKEYDVKATFFVVGREDEQSLRNYKRIVSEGHTIGIHSYSHKYKEIYESLDSYREDLNRLSALITRTTGVQPRLVRFPGGSSNQVSSVDMRELTAYLEQEGYTYFDWNIASGDANSGYISTQRIVGNCLSKLEYYKEEAVILLHDAGDKKTTVEALPIIIEQIQAMEDTRILPITEDTIPIQHIIDK